MGSPSVLITTEGTYPYYAGGVSVWCDYLVRCLPEAAFHVFAITHAPGQPNLFAKPRNLISCTAHPLWGTEEPGAFDSRCTRPWRRKTPELSGAAFESFLLDLRAALRTLLSGDPSPDTLPGSLFRMHRYFRSRDYAAAMGSREAWEVFLQTAGESCLVLNLREATFCMRWLVRYFSILAARFPKVDIVHSSMAGLAGIPGVLAKFEYGTPFLLTEHGIHLRELYLTLNRCGYSTPCRKFLARFHQAIARMNYRFADQVTALGEFNRRWQLRFGADPAKISIMPNGVDPIVFRPRPSPPRSGTRVLTLARIFPLKGIEVLVRAAALVRKRSPETRFLVLGEVADRDYFAHCQNLVREFALEKHIEFSSVSESAPVFATADLLCLPSLSEGLPYVVLEAMLSGCPVVATEVGNVPELLADAGVLVPPNDPAGLAAGILSLAAGPEAAAVRRKLADAALHRARRHYTLDRFAERYRNAYWSLTHDARVACLSGTAG